MGVANENKPKGLSMGEKGNKKKAKKCVLTFFSPSALPLIQTTTTKKTKKQSKKKKNNKKPHTQTNKKKQTRKKKKLCQRQTIIKWNKSVPFHRKDQML